MIARHDIEARRDPSVAREPGGVAADHQDHVGRVAFDRAPRVAEHVHGRAAAVGVLQQPAQRKAELPGEVHCGVGREREGGDRHALHVARIELCVGERRHHGVAHESVDGLMRLRMPHIGRLADADDGG